MSIIAIYKAGVNNFIHISHFDIPFKKAISVTTKSPSFFLREPQKHDISKVLLQHHHIFLFSILLLSLSICIFLNYY